jgi:dUTP pyrophosphatase
VEPNVKIQLLENGKMPTKGSPGAAGWDLYAAEETTLAVGETKAISVGFKISMPADVEMQVRSRSGLSLKGIVVANSPGTVDSDYRGEVKVILSNTNPIRQPRGLMKFGGPPEPQQPKFEVKKGDRIAQAVFAWVPQLSMTQVDSLDATERGAGGFGSTGK